MKDERLKVTDVRVLAALAHPIRISILHLLMSLGEATATQCAEVVDASPSTCSYHLRYLARFGLIERVPSDESTPHDGRARLWRPVASGFSFGDLHDDETPGLVAASAALVSSDLDESTRLARHYLNNLEDVPDEWTDAATFSTFELLVTADELRKLTDDIDAIARPLRAAVRDRVPDSGARRVLLSVVAFLRTDIVEEPA